MSRQKGAPKTGGRQKGTPNKVSGDLRAMVTAALDEVGGSEYLKEQARENPNAFLGLLGKCLPKDIKADISVSLKRLIEGAGATS